MNGADAQPEGLVGQILVVDDERNIRRALRMVLEGEGATVNEAASGEQALALLQDDAQTIQVVVMDVLLPEMSGLDVLEAMTSERDGRPSIPVIMISGHASVEDAVRATRLGAFDFFEKPLVRDRVIVSVRNALRQYETDRELQALRARVRGSIVGDSPPVGALLEQIAKVGPSKARVLIMGESGTGKELVARALHEESERSGGPFVKVNCAAIPPELIESELFGHERGAFTGATSQKKGLFEVADGGTILLDEVGDMAPHAQAKVLRVLQSGELMRVGGQKPIHVDVRVIAATHRNLRELVASGEFREDLYFRLAVVPIQVPPLRDRTADLAVLCRYFIDEACREAGVRSKRLSEQALATLSTYDWPGNVRELRNVIERMVILSDGDLQLEDVPPEIRGSDELGAATPALVSPGEAEIPPGMSLKAFRDGVERAFILQRLEEFGWNVSQTAQSLDIERTHLHRKMKLLGIQRGSR